MRIGLYGLPCSGKNYLLEKIDFMDVKFGSKLMIEKYSNFKLESLEQKTKIRVDFANSLKQYDNFIMDGHYSFGKENAFTEADGSLYDVFIYLYVPRDILKERMKGSQRNNKYLKYNLHEWQEYEIQALREYCHRNDKDFYIIDSPDNSGLIDVNLALEFIKDVYNGFSCIEFSKRIVNELNIKYRTIHLLDGDKTYCKEDTSRVFYQYKTKIFDNNFYTGFQSWRLYQDFEKFDYKEIDMKQINIRERFINLDSEIIITSGYPKIWKIVCEKINVPLICGKEVCADTKYFITKFLKENNTIIAYGDSMIDYYMVKEAHEGYIFINDEGKLSRSLKNVDLGGIKIVSD